MKRERICHWLVLSMAILSVGHGVARAQNAADKAAADTLFGEGKKLIGEGDTAEACAKFEASLARAVQLGTQVALGACYEKLGKTASAWGEFRAAASAAARAHDYQRQQFAEQHAAVLETKLSRLVVKLEPGYRVDALEIKRDGVDVTPAELGTPVPVDPGEHSIEARAPGWVAWSNKVTVEPTPGVVEVVVPALGKAPVRLDNGKPVDSAAVTPEPGNTSATDPRRTRRYLAYGIGGGGAAIVGTSLILGAVAASRWSDAQTHCQGDRCDVAGAQLAHSAQGLGNVSTATFLVGAAALSAGAYLFITARSANTESSPPDGSTALRVVPSVGTTQIGLTLQGGF